MEDETTMAKREIIHYEYYLLEAHRYVPELVDETWELHDIFPKREDYRYFYVCVFRRATKPKELATLGDQDD